TRDWSSDVCSSDLLVILVSPKLIGQKEERVGETILVSDGPGTGKSHVGRRVNRKGHDMGSPSRGWIEALAVIPRVLAAQHEMPSTQDLHANAKLASPVALEAKHFPEVSMRKGRHPGDLR